MATVALDSDVLIGFLDPSDAQHDRAVNALRPWLNGEDEVVIGASVYAETMVQPLRHGSQQTVDDFVDAAGMRVIPVDRPLARQAAELRARHKTLRLPDALSLATALAVGGDLLTLDRRLHRIARDYRPD
jgi:predicted nucleic acid-binding protein